MSTIDWVPTALALDTAAGIAYDGCHKIYVLRDQAQVDKMREWEYEHVLTGLDAVTAYHQILDWYDLSCGLRFVTAVKSPGNNEDYVDLVAQGADWEEEGEEW